MRSVARLVAVSALVAAQAVAVLAPAAGGAVFGRVGALQLGSGEDEPIAIVIDPEGTYAYAATFTFPGQVVKIDLKTFERVGAITFAEDEAAATQGAIMAPDGQHAYVFTTYAGSQARMVKIDLETFTRVGHLDIGDIGWVDVALVDAAGTTAYLGRNRSGSGPNVVDKIDLETFTLVDTIELENAVEMAGAIDPLGRYAVFAQDHSYPSYLHRVDLDTFEVDRTLTYDSDQPGVNPASVVIDPAGTYAYAGAATSPGAVARVDLATFDKAGALQLPVGDGQLTTGVMTPDGRSAYFGIPVFPGEVVRVDLASFQRAGKVAFADGEDQSQWASAIDPKGEFAYFGTRTKPGWIVKVALSPGGPDGTYRVSGSNRFETAAEVALDRFVVGQVDVAYLATGTNFPDALAGGPLAAVTQGPILLAERDVLPPDTRDALAVLQPGRVVALGGAQAVSDAVLNQAAAAAGGATTDRLWGPDRYATAAAIAAALPATGTVFVTTGENFPDALAGGAATGGSPILLVAPTALPGPTREALETMRPDRVVALGGANAVSDAVLAEAGQAAGGAVTSRLSGDDRYATAVGIAKSLPTPDAVYVATGVAFPDALAGGPAASGEGAPTLLVTRDAVPQVVTAYLESLPGLRRVVVLGGTVAVSDEVMVELQSHAG